MQQTNGYNPRGRGGRGARGFRGYRPRYIRRGGFRAEKEGGPPRVSSFYPEGLAVCIKSVPQPKEYPVFGCIES
jgi:hypothetical protein